MHPGCYFAGPLRAPGITAAGNSLTLSLRAACKCGTRLSEDWSLRMENVLNLGACLLLSPLEWHHDPKFRREH